MRKLISKTNVYLFTAISAILLILLLTPSFMSPPEVRSKDTDTEFSARRAIERLQYILGDETPHPVDSDANDQVRSRLLSTIEELGYTPAVGDNFSCSMPGKTRITCARVRNVWFIAGPNPKQINLKNALMIASHYDSVPAGPGASDDGIGVATSLEIANLLSAQNLTRPIIFLFTDGEEAGLKGAESFVKNNPLAEYVSDVINMEARGTKGPTTMFQTAFPNFTDISHFKNGADRPVSNAVMTDMYRIMPNDTDLTRFLEKGYSGQNYAIADGFEFYHTPQDNITNLDLRSLQHMGDLTYGSVMSQLTNDLDESKADQNLIFTDILTLFLIVLPAWTGLPLILFGGAVACFGFIRGNGSGKLRAILTPPLALTLTIVIASCIQLLIGLLRTEDAYWSAYPNAVLVLTFTSSVLACLLAGQTVKHSDNSLQKSQAVWIWMAIIGLTLGIAVPGTTIVFALPLAIYGISTVIVGILGLNKMIPSMISVIGLIALFAPIVYVVEILFGYRVISIISTLCTLLILPLILVTKARGGQRNHSMVFTVAIFIISMIGVAVMPAYSPERPGKMNFVYEVDMDNEMARWVVDSPDKQAFKKLSTSQVRFDEPTMNAPYSTEFAPDMEFTQIADDDSSRSIQLSINSDGADRIMASIPASVGSVQVSIHEDTFTLEPPFDTQTIEQKGEQIFYDIECFGRACDGLVIEVTTKQKTPIDWRFSGTKYELPDSGSSLVTSRPEYYTPYRRGDSSSTVRSKSF